MRLDEMIIKANADGKTYFNETNKTNYSAANGFNGFDTDVLFNEGWEELQKPHLSVLEAEKELDCVIDTPDISKLLRPMDEKPFNRRNVIIICDETSYNTNYSGYYDGSIWRLFDYDKNPVIKEYFRWIDPADLIKLLPKE